MFSHFIKNDALSKYIRYIQVFEPSDLQKEYLIFPNCGTAITFYKDVEFFEETPTTFSEKFMPGNRDVVLHINRIDPVHIKDSGQSTHISVVFYPLGINHFIKTALQELQATYNPTIVRIEKKEPPYKVFAEELFNFETNDEKIRALESFFLTQLNSFQNNTLEKVIPQLENVYNEDSIETIAKNAYLTVKTLERLFKKHICLNPVQYRCIARFRNSIRHKLINGQSSLTNMSTENNYSDLPYMIRAYQKFTGQSVNSFFEKLSTSADGNYIYQVM